MPPKAQEQHLQLSKTKLRKMHDMFDAMHRDDEGGSSASGSNAALISDRLLDVKGKLEQLLSDVKGCQPCSGEESKEPCSCSTVPARMQDIAAAMPPTDVYTFRHMPFMPPREITSLLLELCERLVKHNHSSAALLAASEAFYK